MARIKKYAPEQKLSSFQTFILDENSNSDYFRITEFKDTFTGGKNGFLIEGSQYLKESTEIKIEILDVEGNPVYFEPGNGIPEYYEGISKLIAVYIYNDTPIGLGKITVLGELKKYQEDGVTRDVPDQWKGSYNVKWEKTFQINKTLSNEDKVRFYRRPEVVIDEIVKPIFSGNPPSVTQTGSVDGIPLVPLAGSNLSDFILPTSYRLKVNSGNKWTGSVEGEKITFDNITYSPTIEEIVNETEIVVSPPYVENNIVTSFTNEDYSVEFPYIEGVSDLATALTGSFAKISITNMKTFVGDAARVKVFRRSQSNLTDFEFVQEIQLESNELLRDITTFAKKEEPYGLFSQTVIDDYWVTSSNDFDVTFNQNFLYNSAKLDSTPGNYFFTSESFSIQSGVEYTLDLNVRKETTDPNAYVKVFLSGSNNGKGVTQQIANIPSSTFVLQKTNFSENILANNFDNAKLYFETSGSDWYVNNVSLKASQETSFSPDEITFIQQVPKTLVTETFDYRFEFYDINNNYIPIFVEDTKTFTGGNTNLFKKSIELNPDNLYFSFDSASNPANAVPPLTIAIDVDTTLVTGSITYTSGAYDFFGNLLSSSQYVGGIYPGYLTDWDVDSGRQPFLRVQDFTGSRDDKTVQFIRYTGAIEGVSDTFVISRVEDGKGGVSFEIVPFRGVQIKNKESKTLEIQAIRVDGINRIDLRAGLEKGFSDAKLHILSSSLDGTDTYVSLSQAITNPNFIEGISAGTTGSGEIDYNATFTRDAIDNELTVYLMDGPTTESILTSQILTDLKDGLNPGLITSTGDQFNIKYKPRELFSFDPSQIIVTSSFQQRGSTLNPLTASLIVKPSASIQPLTELPQLFVFYDTGAFDDTITVAVTNVVGDSIDSGFPGISVPYYTPVQTKQLNFEFTYTEPVTSASVTANKSFFITPDGLPGQDSIVIDVDPNPVSLGSNHKGEVVNYSLANTDIQITQGDLFLINTASGNPGTFTTTSIVPTNITYGTLVGDSTTTMNLAGFESMSALSASVKYNFEIHPYFTSSLVTASKTQKFTKVVDGGGPIEVTLDPIATALNADEIGFVSNYSSATTEVFIKQNDEPFYYDEFDGGRPGTFVTESITLKNIQFSEVSSSFRDLIASGSISSSDGEILHFKGFSGLANNQPSASIVYKFKVYPYSLTGGTAGVPRIVSKTQTLSKVSDGTAARKVSLAASSLVVVYNGDGIKVAPDGDVSLTANATNVSGSSFFTFLNSDGSTIQASSTDNILTTVSDLPATGSSKTFTVELRDGLSTGPIVDTDSVTISGIGEGSTAFSTQLSNPASSIGVEVDGTTFLQNTGTLIRAYKGGFELQYVEVYDEQAVDPETFLPIGTFGQFSASIYQISTYLTHDTGTIDETASQLYGTSNGINNWNSPQQNPTGFIIYKVDFENGRGEQFIQQSFSAVFEGATGPGIVMRGEWTGSLAYIFDQGNQRRDAVLRDVSGTTHYWATTQLVPSGSEYIDGDDVYTLEPILPSQFNSDGTYVEGTIDTNGWEYLGEQELFVAAKIAIFDESFVKNTINVGIPPAGNPNAQIAIAGGTDEPYISVGQTGIQGYGQLGAFIGVSNDLGGAGAGANSTSGILSLSGDPTQASYNALSWNGETLTIRGAIKQTAAGASEPQLRGIWATGVDYAADDLVIYNGQSWTADSAHTSNISGNATDGPPATGPWTAASGTGKTVSLSADTFVIEYDQDGNNPSPSSINLFASSSNFIDPYFKFTGGGTIWTGDDTTFTDGSDTNNDIVSSIDLSGTTISDMPLQFRVGVSDGGLSGQGQVELISDVINIFGVKPGSDTDPNFFITPIAGGTQIKNSSGTIVLQVQKADITGVTNITSGTDARIYDGGTLLATQTGVSGTVSAAVPYNPTIGASFITGTKTLLLKDASLNVLDSITLLDVTDGLGGGSFIASSLKTNRDTSVTPNTFFPTSLTAQASFYDTSGTERTQNVTITPSFVGGVDKMQVSSPTGDTTNITITADDGDGTSISLAGSSVATKDVVLTAVFTDPTTSQTTTINETFYIVSDGVDGIDAITVINTNQAHIVAANSDGTVSGGALTNSGTIITVYEGVTPLDFTTGTAGNGQYTISVGSIGSATLGSITAVGTSPVTAVVADATGMTTAQLIITYTISGKRTGGAVFTSTTTQTLTKTNAGINGQAAGVVYAGDWKLTKNDGSTIAHNNRIPYLGETDLVYVVKDLGSYYTCEVTHRYAGAFDSGDDYEIGDVVFTGGNYYLATIAIIGGDTSPGDSGFASVGSSIQPNTQQVGDNFWASFGAEFTSVATDILFAEDVYANRTINVGTGENGKPVISLNADTANGSASPFISIGQSTQAFEEDGIFLGYPSQSSAPVMSLVSGSDYLIYNDGIIALSNAALVGTGSSITGPSLKIGYNNTSLYPRTDARGYNFSVSSDGIVSASEANIKGTIEASAGNIGQWIITPPENDSQGNSIGGILQDDDGEIRFNPNNAEIQIFSASYEETSIEAPLSTVSIMTVTAVNNIFYIDQGNGAEVAPVLNLERSAYADDLPGYETKVQPYGYRFDLSDGSLSGKEFSFSMRENGQGTYGSRYNKSTTLDTDINGQRFLIITSSASPGSSGAYIDITPSSSMVLGGIGNGLIGDPDGMEFWYYCENHVGAGNRVYIYDNGKAVTSTANYTERVTVGAQNSFTDTAGGGANFSFAAATQAFYKFFNGITTTTQWGSVNTKTETQYTAASTAVTLTAGPVSLVNIVYPSVHVKSQYINASTYTSNTPQYQPSYDGQVHGGNSMMYFLSAGYRTIYQYFEVYNSATNEIVGQRYLNAAAAYGAKDGTHQWVADDQGGGGIYSVIGTTEITLEDGTTKLAKDITLNDRILSWDSNTDMWISARISDIKKRNVNEVYKLSVDGNDIEVSDSHGFWLFGNEQNSGQITAKELYKNKEAGSPMTQDSLKLWVKDGDSKKKVSITNIRKVEKDIEVITISVPNYVNYVSNNIISHNVYGGGGSLQWYQQSMSYASSATGVATSAGGTTSLDLEIPSAGDYKVRFKINLTSKARMSVTVGQNSSPTVTTTYTAHSYRYDSDDDNDDAYSNTGYTSSTLWRPTVAIQKNNNFVEIIPAGIQVVSGTGRYSRLSRRDQTSSDVELLEVIDGSVKIQSRNSVSSGTSTIGIEVDGDIVPETNTTWDIGKSNKYWENGYFVNLNGAYFDSNIRTMVAGGVFTGHSTTNDPSSFSVYDSFNISSCTRTAEGVFTISIANTSTFNIGDSYVYAQGYGVSGDSNSQNPGDSEFVITWGTKVNGSTVQISSGDNDTNNRRDFYKCYFTLWSR